MKIKIIELSATTGNPVDQPILVASDSEVLSEESILYVGANSGIPYVIWTDKSLKNLKLNIIGTKHIVQANAPNSNGNPIERITVHAPKSSTAKAHILIQYQEADSHRAEVYHFTSEAAKKAYDLPRLSGKGAFSASSQDSDVYFIRYTAVENTLVSSIDSTVLNHWKIQPETDGAVMDLEDITHAVSEVVYRGGSTYAVRSALAMPSGEWKLVRNGESIWVRAEGLTGVVAAAFVEIPKLESLAEELAVEGRSDILTAYVHRVKRHLRDMQYFPAWIKALRQRVIANLTREKTHSKDHGLHRDGFGFRKLIVVATENGRLAALDTGNQGAVVWNIQAVNLRPGLKWEPLAIEAKEGTVLIRGEGGEFLRVVSSTGSILQYQPGTILSSWKTLIPVRDVSGNSVLLPVHDDGSLGELPIADFGKETVIVTQDKNHAVRGWTLSNDSKPVMSWGFAPAVGEYVTGIFARPQHDPVASIGKVLGDRNVLYKYLNPNIVLISTVNAKRSIASFYILDAISGAVIYSTHHPGVDLSRPIVSTVSENWFAYSLFSESSAVTQGATQTGIEELRGYQLVVSELYESPYPNDRGPLDSSSKSSSLYASKEGTRDIVDTPHVVSQTFLMPGPTSSMSVTSTLQGITTRSLLCVIPDINSIISISRAFVDPRRPVGRDATAAEIEEGLFRYNPVLEFEPKWILNHQRELISVSDVITSPSLLESTSLVFGFGEIDLFGTRVTPIGAFDILGKGFSKLQLVLTVVALAIGTVLVAPFVSLLFYVPFRRCANIFLGTKKAD